jgi:hypothetical protein
MEEITKKEIAEEQTTSTEEEITTTEQETDPLKEAIEEQLKKIQRQNLLIGAQTMCRVILDKIIATESKPGKTTMADYRRLVKDIRNFCATGLSRKVNADGETEPVVEESSEEETIQN